MRLSLFCNARRKSRRCQTSPRCCETKDGISSHSGTARQQCCRVHARAYAPGCRSIFQGHAMRGTPCLRRTEQQTSAAAEGACAESPLGGTVATQASACSGAVENFKSPKHHDDSRYQRGRHQHTFQGSDSHPLYSPLPSPASGLVDSRAAAIIRSQCYQSCVKVVVCGAQWGTWCSSKGKGPARGLFDQWCQNKAISRMIGSGTPNSQSNAPFVKSMSSSSKAAWPCNAGGAARFRASLMTLSVGGQPPDADQVQRPGAVMSDNTANQTHCGRSL